MNEQHDGGPAFPVWELNGQGKPEMTGFGMTLRDYFAAKALQGAAAYGTNSVDAEQKYDVAVWCYQMADAMLAARNAKEGA